MPNQAFVTPWLSGLETLSLTLDTTAVVGTATTVTLGFTIPEALTTGDTMVIFFIGWTSNINIATGVISGSGGLWNYAWNSTVNEMTLTLNQATNLKTFSLLLSSGVSLVSPINGVGEDSVKFSTFMLI